MAAAIFRITKDVCATLPIPASSFPCRVLCIVRRSVRAMPRLDVLLGSRPSIFRGRRILRAGAASTRWATTPSAVSLSGVASVLVRGVSASHALTSVQFSEFISKISN